MTLFKMARNFTSISEIKFQLREIHTGNLASVATPSNSSRAPDTFQILLVLPCVFRPVKGPVCKKGNCRQAHVQSCLSCCSRQSCSFVEPLTVVPSRTTDSDLKVYDLFDHLLCASVLCLVHRRQKIALSSKPVESKLRNNENQWVPPDNYFFPQS